MWQCSAVRGGGSLGSDVKRERPHPVQSMKTVNYKDCWGRGGGQAKRAWRACRLEGMTTALSPQVAAKPTARLHPCGVMKESIISSPSPGEPSGSQHLCTDTDPGLLYCCSDEQRSTLILGSVRVLSPLLPPFPLYPPHRPPHSTHPSLHRGLSTRTHIHKHAPALLAAISKHFMQRTRCLGVIAAAPLPPNLTFTACRLLLQKKCFRLLNVDLASRGGRTFGWFHPWCSRWAGAQAETIKLFQRRLCHIKF